jgi:hypothetical protein
VVPSLRRGPDGPCASRRYRPGSVGHSGSMRRLAALALALCWAGLSCSSSSPPPKPTDPCSLVTTAEAAHALGVRHTEITHRIPAGFGGGPAGCVFQTGPTDASHFVEVQTLDRVTRQQFQNDINTALDRSVHPPGPENITGLGDQAIWIERVLDVHKGTSVVMVQVSISGDSQFGLSQEKYLAAIALKRL